MFAAFSSIFPGGCRSEASPSRFALHVDFMDVQEVE
jgi:hypothetical protein